MLRDRPDAANITHWTPSAPFSNTHLTHALAVLQLTCRSHSPTPGIRKQGFFGPLLDKPKGSLKFMLNFPVTHSLLHHCPKGVTQLYPSTPHIPWEVQVKKRCEKCKLPFQYCKGALTYFKLQLTAESGGAQLYQQLNNKNKPCKPYCQELKRSFLQNEQQLCDV